MNPDVLKFLKQMSESKDQPIVSGEGHVTGSASGMMDNIASKERAGSLSPEGAASRRADVAASTDKRLLAKKAGDLAGASDSVPVLSGDQFAQKTKAIPQFADKLMKEHGMSRQEAMAAAKKTADAYYSGPKASMARKAMQSKALRSLPLVGSLAGMGSALSSGDLLAATPLGASEEAGAPTIDPSDPRVADMMQMAMDERGDEFERMRLGEPEPEAPTNPEEIQRLMDVVMSGQTTPDLPQRPEETDEYLSRPDLRNLRRMFGM